jgi:hypothetical protein
MSGGGGATNEFTGAMQFDNDKNDIFGVSASRGSN